MTQTTLDCKVGCQPKNKNAKCFAKTEGDMLSLSGVKRKRIPGFEVTIEVASGDEC